MEKSTLKKYVAECIGTCVLVLRFVFSGYKK